MLLPVIGIGLNGTSIRTVWDRSELVSREARTRAFGIFYTGTAGASAVAPPIMGLFGNRFGVPSTLAGIALGVLLTIPLAIVLNPMLARAGQVTETRYGHRLMSVSVTFVGSGDSFGSGGRFNTCFLVDAPGIRFCIDFGASSLIALERLGIPHNTIDTILLTHLHGDHCGGLPFLLVDAMLAAKRDRPLTVAGPPDTTDRLKSVAAALMPGMEVMVPKFPITYVDMPTERINQIGPLKVLTYPAVHTKETNPTSLRVEAAGKVIAYTGDSEWTEHMPHLADGADLFIAECYFFQKPVRYHLNYPDIVKHRAEIRAKRVILTHLGREMLANLHNVPEQCAHDGLIIQL